tara:strand:+ start:124902 stop:126611 length:1710 start_codon:yes stop_codon:yes gene_type:complete
MKESPLLPILIEVCLFLAVAALVVPLLKKIRITNTLGYLISGIILGPFGIGLLVGDYPFLSHLTFQSNEYVHHASELGIILLLFVIGLELSPQRLWQMRQLVFGLGSAQVIITATAIGGVAYLWGNSITISILIGLALSLSSTAIITQWLQEKKLFATQTGRTTFGILLMQDIAVMPILFLLTILSTNSDQPIHTALVLALGKMIVTGVFIYISGRFVLRPVFIFANKHGNIEVFMALTLLVILLTSSLAGLAGISLALGAFLAGLLLAETEFRHEIESTIMPFKGLLLGIFFISFGMSINISKIFESPLLYFVSAFGLMALKSTIIYVLCRLWKKSHAIATETALLLPQAGEFGLLVIGTTLTSGLVNQNAGEFILIIIGITMIATPVISPIARKIGQRISDNESPDVSESTPSQPDIMNISDHLVIIGYGRVGHYLSERLATQGMHIIALDKNAAKFNLAKRIGVDALYGDVLKASTLKKLYLDKARGVVITLNSQEATDKCIKEIRASYPDLPIFARAIDSEHAQALMSHYNISTIPEHINIATQLSQSVLNYLDIEKKIIPTEGS